VVKMKYKKYNPKMKGTAKQQRRDAAKKRDFSVLAMSIIDTQEPCMSGDHQEEEDWSKW